MFLIFAFVFLAASTGPMQFKRIKQAKAEMDSANEELSAILVHLTGAIDQIKAIKAVS